MKRRTRAEWLALFESHKQSGLSATAFCKQNDLCAGYFSQRKKQLLEKGSPLIKIHTSTGAVADIAAIRIMIGHMQVHLQGASPDYLASLLQKLQ